MKNSRENKYKRNFKETHINEPKKLNINGLLVPFRNKTNSLDGFRMSRQDMVYCVAKLNPKGLILAMKYGVTFEDSYICGVKYREMFLCGIKWDVAEFGIKY